VSLERALTLAEPEGYVRVFVDEGARMSALLQATAKRGIAPGYVQRLLTQFGPPAAERHASQNLVEPLSERELEVFGSSRPTSTDPRSPVS
jgi:LuxR family maltose regulon positive regulatory protein